MSQQSKKPRRSGGDRARDAKMRANYTNPYKTTTAAERRVQREGQDERGGDDEWRQRRQSERRANNERTMPQSLIEQLLHNPTKTVTEAELRTQYSHVITDVRNMAVLAGGLIMVLVVLAFILPR